MAPHITAPVPAESATQAASAVVVAAMAVIWSNTEAAAKMIARKAIAAATIPAVAGECGVGQLETSESKDNCKNNYGIA
jgi:hypothetical protein